MAKGKTQLLRLIYIDSSIRQGMKSGRLANCTSLAAGYEVSRKSILRDIDYLKNQQDAPIDYDPARRGYYYTEENYALPAIHITESDLFAICIAEKALRQHENTPIYHKLVSVFKRIENSLPERISLDPSWIDQRLSVIQPKGTVIDPAIWDTVASGLHENRVLAISYQKPGARKGVSRRVKPYHVVSYQGEWYMIGHCSLRNDLLTFAISRIRDAALLAEKFVLPEDLDPARFSEHRFGIFRGDETHTVKIYFDATAAPYVREREYHPDQVIEKQGDGLLLSFPADHLFEIKQWVLSWGAGARVLEPEVLVSEMRKEVAAMAAGYGS